MTPQQYKTTVPIAAWRKVLADDPSLPEPMLSEFSACYVADVTVGLAVLASLERHAGDPDVDQAIQRVRLPLEWRLRFTSKGDGEQ